MDNLLVSVRQFWPPFAHFRPWHTHFMSNPHENLTYKLSDRDLACVKISLNSNEK